VSPRELDIREWKRAAAGPGGEHPELAGLSLDDPELAAALARSPLSGRLRVSESRHGLVVEARQHVGVVQLGPLRVRIHPKLPMARMWTAVAYALGLDGIRYYDPVEVETSGDFADLLAAMLLRETQRLWRAGAQRGYHSANEWRTTLRGRPDLVALARSGPLTQAALPCRYQEFTTDVLDNQVILAGIELARSMSSRLSLRSALQRAVQQWSTLCRRTHLNRQLLDTVDRTRSRLHARYAGAHRLVRLLYERAGLDDANASGVDRVPGFLWNMATLFERFVARFLGQHLPEHEVNTQHGLATLYRVVHDRPGRRAPRPRPDLVIREVSDGRTLAVFDTKYKDLWDTRLPREILYQMSVYALAWSESRGHSVPAVVLYPTTGERPDIEYALDVHSGRSRRIVVRGIDWAAAIAATEDGDAARAHRLALAWSQV